MTPLPKMTRYDWAGIIFLTLVCAVISFARLGDRTAPQTSWTPQANEYAEINFGLSEEIHEIIFRMGARHDRGFTLHSSHDGVQWFHLHTVSGANVFYWSFIPVRSIAQYIRITADSHDLRLQEIAFRNAHGDIIPIQSVTPGAEALTDEQHLIPQRRSFMNSTYFDEIYHPRTAYEYVHGIQVYETTHPPMGKNFIALGIRLFGMTPWAWRMPGTLFGVLMVPLLYAFARALFGSNRWALFAAAVFAFDFMRFVQTRLATIDTYVTFFAVAMYFCMFLYAREVNIYTAAKKAYQGNFLRRSRPILAVCGVMMGLAVASKWQGIYAALGLPVLFFPALYRLYCTEPRYAKTLSRYTFMACFGFFVAVPLLIYALSYIPFILAHSEGGISAAWQNQRHMYDYHAHLVAEHDFASDWWSWPLLVRPLWLYVNRISPEINAGMSTLGNPAIWWFGLAAAGTAIVYAAKGIKSYAMAKNSPARWEWYVVVFLLVAYAAQYLPWVGITRLTFIYHYFPSVPFVVLLITWFFRRYVKYRAVIVGYVVLAAALFFFFYPVLSGLPMEVAFVYRWHTWFSSWVFM
jgi:dolichyl-phosphate-mannose--protein O-mannosyl transferase